MANNLGPEYAPSAAAVANIGNGIVGYTLRDGSHVAFEREPRSWLEYQHPLYRASKAKWAYALAHYTGEVNEPDCVTRYLIKRAVAEAQPSYEERCKLADYTNHYAEVVESLAGMLFAVEANANRVFQDDKARGLGKIEDPATPIGKLWRRADDKGLGYLTLYKRLAILLSVTHTAWFFVDPADGFPVLRVLSPLDVPNWTDGANPEALVIERADARTSLQQPPGAASTTRYLHLTTAGWQRYTLDDNGGPVLLGEPGTWSFTSPTGARALPLFRVELPMARHIGYQLARKANAIFNKESERDHLLRTANFPRLVIPADDQRFGRVTADLAVGANAMQEDPAASGNTRYITPPTESATIATEVLKAKVGDFKATAHKAYDDGAGGGAQKTATEVRQDVSSGTGAYLQLLKAGLDDAENGALWRIEQVVYPDDKRQWFIARVDRADDFMPLDPDAVMERSAAIAWGKDKPVPLGKTALVALAKDVAAARGLTVDEAEITAAVELRMTLDAMEQAATAELSLPPEVRVELLMRLVASVGIVDSEAAVEMAEGGKKKLLDVIREKALATMAAADEAKRRDAEALFGGGPGESGGGPPKPEPKGDPAPAE